MREEQLLLREQKRKEELDVAREKQKLDERMNRTRAAMMENARQLEQKKKFAEVEREQGMQLREKFKNDVEAYQKSVVDERLECYVPHAFKCALCFVFVFHVNAGKRKRRSDCSTERCCRSKQRRLPKSTAISLASLRKRRS